MAVIKEMTNKGVDATMTAAAGSNCKRRRRTNRLSVTFSLTVLVGSSAVSRGILRAKANRQEARGKRQEAPPLPLSSSLSFSPVATAEPERVEESSGAQK